MSDAMNLVDEAARVLYAQIAQSLKDVIRALGLDPNPDDPCLRQKLERQILLTYGPGWHLSVMTDRSSGDRWVGLVRGGCWIQLGPRYGVDFVVRGKNGSA